MLSAHAYWIPLFPLLGFLWILLAGLFRKWTRGDIRLGDNQASFPSILLVCAAWLMSIGVLAEIVSRGPGSAYHFSFPWLNVGALSLHFGWLIDSMTAIMLIVVTTVAAMVQIFSQGYMAGDPRFPRFYAYLNLFTMAMLVLVLSNNLVQLFLAWELMGLASYLLIGFWFEKHSAMRAAKKAFMVTRVGDVGLFFGIALLLSLTGTLDFLGLVVAHPSGEAPRVETRGWISGLAVAAGPAILDRTAPIFTSAPAAGAHEAAGHEASGHEATAHDASGHGAVEHQGPPRAGTEGGAPGAGTSPHEGAGRAEAAAASAGGGAGTHGASETSGAHGATPSGAPVHKESAGDPEAGHAPGAPPAGASSPEAAARARGFMFLLAIASLLVFCGAIGKSAQFPLHVWLPDAMEGPTPVSALIHAATMVAAGVYLVARMYPVFDFGASLAVAGITFRPLDLVAVIGTITALMAAVIALTQPDIKRILAYSTISQLGFMLAALGCGGTMLPGADAGVAHAASPGAGTHPHLLGLGFTAGMFHLMTHAFFKGLLFLGSGSVIHGTGTQDVWEMGGLKRYMPATYWTYLAGYIALAGVPFVAAGFYSKDLILEAAWEYNPLVFWTLLFTAGLTAFYMTRQMMLVFAGDWAGPRGTGSAHAHAQSDGYDGHGGHGGHDGHGGHGGHDGHGGHGGHDGHGGHGGHDGHGGHGGPHESGRWMLIPLFVLAVLAVTSGFVGLPGWLPMSGTMAIFPYLQYARPGLEFHLEPHFNPVVFFSGLLVPILGIALGVRAYRGRQFNPGKALGPAPAARWLYRLSYNKLYFDELYWTVLVRPLFVLTRSLRLMDIYLVDGIVNGVGWLGRGLAALSGLIDRVVVDGMVNGVGHFSRACGNLLRATQTGQIQSYVLVVFGGTVILIWALVQAYLFR